MPRTNSTAPFVIAALLVVAGIIQLFQDQVILGVALIGLGLRVGPAGYYVFRNRQA